MDKYLIAIVLTIALNCNTGLAIAQSTQKYAVVSTDSVLISLESFKGAEAELKSYGEQLEKQLESMQQRLQQKYEALVGMSPMDKAPVEIEQAQNEFQQAQENYQKFEKDSKEKFTKKQQELLAPIQAAVAEGIEKVAKENGYEFVLPSNVMIFAVSADNITTKVIAHVGKQ